MARVVYGFICGLLSDRARALSEGNGRSRDVLKFLARSSSKKMSAPMRISWPNDREEYLARNKTEKDNSLQTSAYLQQEKRRSRYEKLRMMPYFGRFSGKCLLFELKRSSTSSTLVSIRVKLEDSDGEPIQHPLTTLYHTVNVRKEKLGLSVCEGRKATHTDGFSDRCITFAHEAIYPPEVELQLDNDTVYPPPLSFLCQRKILLHMGEINSSNLPYKFNHLNPRMTEYRDVFIRVWSHQLQECSMLRMKIRPRTLILELQWMVCSRLSIASNPTCIAFYQADNLDSISPHSKWQPNQGVLHCIVDPSNHEDGIAPNGSFPLVVSIIGHGINQVRVSPTMTLHQFQEEVRSIFSLQPRSFIYFPAIFQTLQGKSISKSVVRMSAIIDGSTLTLIDSKKAKLPIVNGVPSALVNYEQVPLYQMRIVDLGILNSTPVKAFEITGPTIPLTYKTTQDQLNKDFVIVSEHSHVISVNLHWTVATLLKYVECVSGFPCKHLCLRDSIFPKDSILKLHLTSRNWVINAELVKDIPKIIY